MECLTKNKQGPDILLDYMSGTLDAARSVELERHAAECADCRGLLSVSNTLDEFKAPAVSSNFDARLYARIAQEDSKPWWKRVLWRPVVPIAAACAVLALALAIHVPNFSAPVKQVKVDPEIEQVEQTLEDLELLTPLNTPSHDRL